MTSGSVVHLQLNHLYLIHIEFPTALDKSRFTPKDEPLKPLLEMLELQKVDDPGSSMDYTIRRHTGLVLHYDAQQSTAVILIGSAHPRSFPERYLPWEGTARLPYQPLECLKLPGAQLMRQGYFNFTHCVKVRVMTTTDPTPQLTTLFLLDEEVHKLSQLHSDYWQKLRYSKAGVLQPDTVKMRERLTKEEVSEAQESERLEGLSMEIAILPYVVALILLYEDEKSTQYQLRNHGEIGPEGPTQKVDDLPRCYFFPINQQVDDRSSGPSLTV